MTITNLDPNVHWGKKTFRLTFMQWDYSVTHEVTVGGNCSVFDNLDCVISNLADDIFDKGGEIILKRSNGDELSVDLEDEDHLLKMCVRAELLSVEAEPVKYVAADAAE
jgi:hypothetical protein